MRPRPAAAQALAVARTAGDRWNEGIRAGHHGRRRRAARGDLPEAQRLGEAALAIMRAIDQQWGVARTLLGLADLARLTGDSGGAQRHYEEALAILRVLNARPEIARCLAGLGRIAIDRGRPGARPAAPRAEHRAQPVHRQPDRHDPRA